MELPIKKLHEDAKIPEYSHGFEEDAGMDLVSIEEDLLEPRDYKLFKTGISIALPDGYMAKIAPRSGLAYKHGITVLNAEGTIDPAYRGDIGVILINHGKEPYWVNKGERIAQLIVECYEKVRWNVVKDLNDTERGKTGFGDSGK